MLNVSDFDYSLPPELIAQSPPIPRGASRLLHIDAHSTLHDRRFADITTLLRPHDLLVFNDTRVIKARLHGTKASGGKIEILVERLLSPQRALVHLRASKPPPSGSTLHLADAFDVTIQGRDAMGLFEVSFPDDILTLLSAYGSTPLPPYITHAASPEDDARYQTVYARTPGAVAAPTAGLHFDTPLLEALSHLGVHHAFITLHVGAGTFQPVRVKKIADHRMHAEWYTLPLATAEAITHARAHHGRVIAVGTTSARALESAAQQHLPVQASQGDTRLFITPGFRFQVLDALITNFHLPRSTLLMMVCALAGIPTIRRAYAHAVAQRYHFFSYGDAMFIETPAS